MIIESQDKTKILNFKNIECIGIGNPLENDERKFKILVATVSDNEFSIGEYATEERAKEVLSAIQSLYVASKMYECASAENQEGMCKSFAIGKLKPFIYEMPKG